jgi:hypothetical protein
VVKAFRSTCWLRAGLGNLAVSKETSQYHGRPMVVFRVIRSLSSIITDS